MSRWVCILTSSADQFADLLLESKAGIVSRLTASVLAWAAIAACATALNAGLSWVLERAGSWLGRVRTNRLDPLREAQRMIETALTLGLAGAVAARTGWPFWGVAAVLLVWPLRVVGEIRSAAALYRRPQETLALHNRGFFADRYGPLPTRTAVVLLTVALYALAPPVRAGLDWLAGLALWGAWRLLVG